MDFIDVGCFYCLKEVFNSSNDSRRYFSYDQYADLIKLIRIKAIEVKKVTYKLDKKWKSEISHNGGGEWHRDLCKTMTYYTKKELKGKVLQEDWVTSKRVDIYDEINKNVIECGDTDPYYVMCHLLKVNFVKRFIVVPFQNFKGNFDFYIFTAIDLKKLENYRDKEREKQLIRWRKILDE